MNLSDLLHSQVFDPDGEKLGSVDDVLLVQDGPPLLPFGAAFRVEGLQVGHRAVGRRLGYDHGKVKGPWFLKIFFSTLNQRSRYVPWEDVDTWDGSVVRLAKPKEAFADTTAPST
jgi:hypothetical protein